MVVGCEATAAGLTTKKGPMVKNHNLNTLLMLILAKNRTPLGYDYPTTLVSPEYISLVPILRSGIGMVEGISLCIL